jgi:ElaB/YqjD/DUF883 family membrane-anchored ribosome-binding protein
MSYTAQLERDTEQRRLELASTITELRERLTPGEVLDEVLDFAGDGDAANFLRNLRRQVVDNPLPLGLIALSVAWLAGANTFGRRGNGAVTGKGVARQASDVAADLRAQGTEAAAQAQEAGAHLAESARAASRDLADNTRRTVRDLGDRATAMRDDAAHRAKEAANRAADMANEIGHSSRAAGRAVSDFAHEQPLLVGAAGLVVGALIGAVLPSTEVEDDLIGESADAAKQKLRDLAGEQYDKAKDIAARTAEAALDEATTRSARPSDEPAGRDRAAWQEPREFGPGPGDQDEQAAATSHSDGA